MGLDMYLTRRHFLSQFNNERKGLRLPRTLTAKGVKASNIQELIEEAGYWRKANAIHSWIVNHVQDGEDDCKEYYFNAEKRTALLQICRRILELYDKNPEGEEWMTEAKASLPPTEGFFFGTTDLDEWYIDGLRDTVKILEKSLESDDSYYYQSSW